MEHFSLPVLSDCESWVIGVFQEIVSRLFLTGDGSTMHGAGVKEYSIVAEGKKEASRSKRDYKSLN